MESILARVIRERELTDAAVGSLVGCKSQHINRIKNGRKRASPELAIALEQAFDGAVRRGDVRPDLWPEASSNGEVTLEDWSPSETNVEERAQ